MKRARLGPVVLLSLLTASSAVAADFTISSKAFVANGEMAAKYSCEGADLSPPLAWSGAPKGTKSFALIVDDPDAPDPKAPKTTWVHWLLFDVPATTNSLPEGAHASDLPSGTQVGTNDFKKTDYRGPCPPIGRHRYFFKLYALDKLLSPLKNATKASIEKAMQGHVLAQAQVVGTYQKTKTKPK